MTAPEKFDQDRAIRALMRREEIPDECMSELAKVTQVDLWEFIISLTFPLFAALALVMIGILAVSK